MNLGPIKDRTKRKNTIKLTKQGGYAVAFAVLALVGVIAAVSLGGNQEQTAELPSTNAPTATATVKPVPTQKADKDVGGVGTVTEPEKMQLCYPVAGKQVTKDYAMDTLVLNQTLNKWCTHSGVDFACNEGDDVCTVLDGVVAAVQQDRLMGNTVVITHDGGLETRYMGLNTVADIKQGDKLKKGQVIGSAGNTALNEYAQGAHLHYEMLLDGEYVDPNDYLSNMIK